MLSITVKDSVLYCILHTFCVNNNNQVSSKITCKYLTVLAGVKNTPHDVLVYSSSAPLVAYWYSVVQPQMHTPFIHRLIRFQPSHWCTLAPLLHSETAKGLRTHRVELYKELAPIQIATTVLTLTLMWLLGIILVGKVKLICTRNFTCPSGSNRKKIGL